jgi:Ca2+-binding RTX toxin-like protein
MAINRTSQSVVFRNTIDAESNATSFTIRLPNPAATSVTNLITDEGEIIEEETPPDNGGNANGVFVGTDGDDEVFADSANNLVLGLAGNHDLYGFAGDDTIDGGDGDDRLFDDAGNDQVFAGAGNDSVFGGDGNDFIDGGVGDDQVFGGFGNDTIIDTSGNDRLDGQSGNDLINGGVGSDSVIGGNDNDTVSGGDGGDSVSGGSGNDRILVDNDSFLDALDGGKGTDIIDFSGLTSGVTYTVNKSVTINGVADTTKGFEGIVGTDFADTLIAGGIAELVEGGGGADTLTGGNGNDTFAYAQGDGGDLITDFAIGKDKFALDAETFGLAADATVAFQNVARDGTGSNAGLVNVEGGKNVYVLQGSFVNAGAAADALALALADNGVDEGAGFFVYFNEGQQRARLFSVADLDNVDSSIALLANLGLDDGAQSGAINLLPTFTESAFGFI